MRQDSECDQDVKDERADRRFRQCLSAPDHVIHHIFPTIPHYRLQEATDAVKPLLGGHYLKSDRFVVSDFVSSQLRCHYVVSDDGFERYESAYGWLKPN